MNSFEGNVTGRDDGTPVLCDVTSREETLGNEVVTKVIQADLAREAPNT